MILVALVGLNLAAAVATSSYFPRPRRPSKVQSISFDRGSGSTFLGVDGLTGVALWSGYLADP